LFLTAIVGADCSVVFFVSSAAGGGDACPGGLSFLGATGAAFPPAANKGDAERIDIEMRTKSFFIVFQ
jgi:hypothetical protein